MTTLHLFLIPKAERKRKTIVLPHILRNIIMQIQKKNAKSCLLKY